MALVRMRAQAVALSLCLAVAIGLAAPVAAHAVLIGDGTSSNPLQVSVLPFAHEATLVSAPETGDFDYWYVLPLTKGQTIEVTTTAVPALDAYSIVFAANYADPYSFGSDYIAPGVDRLRYMAPHTDDYFVCVIGSAASTVSVNAVTIPAVRFSLKSMSAPSTAKPRKTFTVSAKITPGYNSSTSPMRFYLQRKSSGRWKTYGASKVGKLSTYSTVDFSKFSASFKLSKGTYRVRAGFKDAAHPKTKYNSFKTVKVK